MTLAAVIASGTLAYVAIGLYRRVNGAPWTARESIVWVAALLVGLCVVLAPLATRW